MTLAAFFDPIMLGAMLAACVIIAMMQNGLKTTLSSFAALFTTLWTNSEKHSDEARRGWIIMSDIVRKRGTFCADRVTSKNPFTQDIAHALANGQSSHSLREKLEWKLTKEQKSFQHKIRFWHNMADSAPAMGILGTITGLIMLFGEADSASAIGEAMAVSLLSSLYGLILANLVFGRIAQRLSHIAEQELEWKTDLCEKVISLAETEMMHSHNPLTILEKNGYSVEDETQEKPRKIKAAR